MATIGGNVLTLTDWAKRLDPNGKTARIIEILNQTNEIIPDIPFMEGNLPTGHQTTIRTGLPEVYYRLLNQGVPKSKSTTVQVTEGTSLLEARSEVDVDLAKLNGNVGEFRLSEATPFLEAMTQKTAQTLFYGNSTVNPEQFNGLSVRYSDPDAANGDNIIDMNGSNGLTSIWLIVWGDQKVSGIFPKGSEVGLVHNDLGIGDAFDANDNRFRAYMDQYQWKAGLVVKDWRYAVRIANIDTAALISGVSAPDLVEGMIKAMHRIPMFGAGKAAFYMNRTVYQFLDLQRRSDVKAGGQLSYEVVDGRMIPFFRNIPVRKVDALLNTETAVS